jgi:muramidase (phage lysozyme)
MSRISAGNAGGKNVCAFLDMLAWSEGTRTSRYTKDGGYDVVVGSVDSPNTFNNYAGHPNSW